MLQLLYSPQALQISRRQKLHPAIRNDLLESISSEVDCLLVHSNLLCEESDHCCRHSPGRQSDFYCHWVLLVSEHLFHRLQHPTSTNEHKNDPSHREYKRVLYHDVGLRNHHFLRLDLWYFIERCWWHSWHSRAPLQPRICLRSFPRHRCLHQCCSHHRWDFSRAEKAISKEKIL